MERPVHGFEHEGMPPELPGFSHINRYWDRQRNTFAAKILPGEYYVTRNDELIVTVLGSCISCCIRDPDAGVGGMNHFMLPAGRNQSDDWARAGLSAGTRYGSLAMEHLINDLLKEGANRARLEVKIFGGGRVLANMTDVGKRNIEFVREYVSTESLGLVSEDLGDIYPRKVVYHPKSGRVQVKKLRTLRNATVAEREARYMKEIGTRPVVGEVDLF